jgi:hypothetical protein
LWVISPTAVSEFEAARALEVDAARALAVEAGTLEVDAAGFALEVDAAGFALPCVVLRLQTYVSRYRAGDTKDARNGQFFLLVCLFGSRRLDFATAPAPEPLLPRLLRRPLCSVAVVC